MSLEYLFSDPRPEIKQDTNHWNKLLRLVSTLDDKQQVGMKLQRLLWTTRSAGTMLKPSVEGLKLVLILGESSGWETEQYFEKVKKDHLGPYSTEIHHLLKKVIEP
ncbi:hypothetical protein [Paenibacillus radicis (ex Xue et al. 2023)]|uniref:Uncharacterized protein n=1 Tax=Paenibacillus radicis (ex Xue et al. 2023) TaxID=2972489 RepID=A0ABT1YJT7_9BACL|nr:hypothetical protein [Paenibacillus radicis (ex Xue et al. 2023)]MCR8633460.1 hypothetical protein [Paenibacillus radicis (ex Xue et al. 2023)]